jgi:hypothetical protein
MKLVSFVGVCFVFALLTLPALLWSQAASGAIAGYVKDPSGAVVPGATVTAVEEQTGVAVTVTSQPDGAFLVAQLPPAIYRLSGEKTGFKRLVIARIKVNVETTTTQDLVLAVGSVSDSVEVVGQTSLVETTNGEVGTTIEVSHVLEMPLVDRNVFSLATLVPGVFGSGTEPSIGGGRLDTVLSMVDGIANSRSGIAQNGIELQPPVDSMQEFKVEVNNFGAEFGHTTGGVVNAVTKSGSNRLKGSLYEFLRNDKFDARGWGADANPPLRRNNYGGTVGGPIRKNRTFFFFNFDGLREHDGVATTRAVPLPEWRTGNFSTLTRDANGKAALVILYDPNTGTGNFGSPLATTPFAGNIIPTSRLDPVALKAVSYYPQPNRAPNDPFNNSGNWQENTVNVTSRDYYTGKVDHAFSDQTKAFVRYIIAAPNNTLTGYSAGYGPADPNGLAVNDKYQNLAINVTHLFSPTWFMNWTGGFNRVYVDRKSGDCCATNWGEKLGIPNVPGQVFPRFVITGGTVSVSNLGANGDADRYAAFTTTENKLDFTDVLGKHTLKYGIQYTRFNANDHDQSQPSGQWTSNGSYTRGILANGNTVANTGADLADFMLGRLSAVTAQISPSIGKRFQYYAGYVQDDWRVTQRLTLNLGLRYDTESPLYEVAGRMSNFDPYVPNPLAGTNGIAPGQLGVMDFPNLNGNGKYLWNWNKLNFGPRFGFAWRALGDNNTVVRGGIGLFYGDAYDREIIQEEHLGFDEVYQARTPVPFVLQNGVPAGTFSPIPTSALVPTFGDRGTPYIQSVVQYLDPHRKTPHNLLFNLTIQHQWKGVLFEIAGLGNLGRQADFGNINMNHIPPNLLSQTQIEQYLRRPFTQFDSEQAQVQILSPNWGISNYLAFTFKSERRYQNGMGWIVSYAHSRWIDNLDSLANPEGDNNQIQNIYNLKGERSNSTNDIPHRLVLSPIYELPFGKNRRWLKTGILSNVIGGWQLATIGTLQSGSPFGTTVLNGPLDLLGDNSDGTTLRADLVSSQLYSPNKGQPAVGVRGIQYLNPAAFAAPAPFTYGNSSRTLPGVYGPGMISFDLMLAKNFIVHETWHTQFRWEAFNFTNTPTWGYPTEALGNGQFGLITSASGRRIMQVAAKVYW